MGNGYLPAAPEQNPGPPARQSAVCEEDLIYSSICSGARNNQNYRGRPTNVCSRTAHYLRRNRGCSFGRTNTLAGKLSASVVVGWLQGTPLGGLHDVSGVVVEHQLPGRPPHSWTGPVLHRASLPVIS